MALVRVYHPDTNEPFDLPEAKATRLRLEEGWLSQPFERVEAPMPFNLLNWEPPAVPTPEVEKDERPRGRGRKRAQPAAEEGSDETLP